MPSAVSVGPMQVFTSRGAIIVWQQRLWSAQRLEGVEEHLLVARDVIVVRAFPERDGAHAGLA